MNGPELRDIHLPAEPLWWPPAPGWWLLILLVVAAAAGYAWWRRRRRPAVKRGLARELDAIRLDYRQGRADERAAVDAATRLLRRALIGYQGRRETAASTGDAWLARLEQLAPEPVFNDQQRQWLARGRYRREAECDVEALLQACEHWIHQLPRESRHAAN